MHPNPVAENVFGTMGTIFFAHSYGPLQVYRHDFLDYSINSSNLEKLEGQVGGGSFSVAGVGSFMISSFHLFPS